MALEGFRLRAHLIRGVVAEPYGLDLSGILASRIIRQRKDSNPTSRYESTKDNPQDIDLPLDMCAVGEDNWHWSATCGKTYPLESLPQEPHTYYRVVNDSWVGRTAHRPLPYYNFKSGAYRDVMMPAHVVLTPYVDWFGVGNLDKIMGLVKHIRSIGKRRAKGEGVVHKWEIEKVDKDPDKLAHCGEDDELLRPSPVECATRLDLDYDLTWHAIRPPSWNPNRIRELAVKPEDELFVPEAWEL